MAKVFTITEGLQNMGALKTGGQGSVYKAKRIGEIITAVKLLPTPIHSESEQDKNFVSFQAEVEKLKKVNEEPNPNVVKMLNYGITDSGSFPFIEMEFIEGPDLEELLKPPHDAIFTIKEAVKVAEQLSNALAHCHRLDVKHGDMKSNNVKFNKQTGNYILLDFGLAAMSDEQRRTSLRHAGAIEFMAPEQSAGQLFFQTDVYGFGVILFELLAGQVPYPLADGSETARNMVMLSHMETQPPDLKELRRQNLPSNWSAAKTESEKQVPEWLLSMIYRCLRKKPEERFANGMELHGFIVANSVSNYRSQFDNGESEAWQAQAEKLLKEKQDLQAQLAARDAEIQKLKANHNSSTNARYPGQDDYKPTRRKNTAWIVAFLLTFLVAGGLAYALYRSVEPKPVQGENTNTDSTQQAQQKPLEAIGEYVVSTPTAYFHNEPDGATQRGAWVQRGDEITAYEDRNGFVYTEFKKAGHTTKGWLKKDALLTVEQWKQQQKDSAAARPSDAQVQRQLTQAEQYLNNNQTNDALTIYNYLLPFNVPDAMYGLANLALQGKNPSLNCDDAMSLLRKASDAGNLPAKRTLGFLYMFAENNAVLSINGYAGCNYDKNFGKARLYLTQAANGGDTTARKLLNELNIAGQQEPPQ